MSEFTLEIETVAGIADSEYLDRLAEVVYEIEELIDPLLALNTDASIGANFSFLAETASQAAQRGVALFSDALMLARPLRGSEAAISSFSVESAVVPSTP